MVFTAFVGLVGCASESGGHPPTPDYAELFVTDVAVSAAKCSGSITLRALVANASPFRADVNAAFYHSTSNLLIGVVRDVEIPPSDAEPPFAQVEIVWNNPTPNAALITVVADDDGTGQGSIPETNETDNAFSTTLMTCPGP
jgi:hypothetical protein